MTAAAPGRHRARIIWQLAAASLIVLPWLAAPARADEHHPRAWLERMSYALEALNYEGTLVQRSGTESAVLQVVHRVENGKVTERITALDEVGREIIRDDEGVTCILPDQKSVLVQPASGGEGGSSLRQRFRGGLDFQPGLYRLSAEAGGRVAGRDTRLIEIRPTDAYRYGYRLWLDRVTAMPLRIQVVNEEGAIVEQLVFSQIQLPDSIPPDSVQPSLTVDSFTTRRVHRASTDGEKRAADLGNGILPPGFRLIDRTTRQPENGNGPITHLVYSDGVANVSVFIERERDAKRRTEGATSLGAANAYTTAVGESLVTAVGEVPPATVRQIAGALRPSLAGAAR